MEDDQGENQPAIVTAFLLVALSVSADEAIWFSGPESCGGICVSSPPGSPPVPLNPHILETIEEDFISSFDLSPSGESIVFMELQEGDGWHSSDIWIMDSDGTNLREVVAATRGDEANSFSRDVVWSPDGLEILVWFNRGFFLFYDPEGNLLRTWEDSNVFINRYYSTDLQWTPEGDIVYQGRRDTVFVRNSDGTIKMKIPIPDVKSPKLSPDRSQLAYVIWGNSRADPPTLSSIFVMDTGTRERKFIGHGWVYSWSPSGNQIAYRDIETDGLQIVNADGTDPVFLFETDAWEIDWISDIATGIYPSTWGQVKASVGIMAEPE